MYKTYDFCLMAPRANLCVEQMAGKQSGQEGGILGVLAGCSCSQTPPL